MFDKLDIPGSQGRRGLGNIYVWASGDGGEEDDCNCDGYAASMWTISINSAINDGQNAHYDESCSSTLASTFSNGAKDPNIGVVSGMKRTTDSASLLEYQGIFNGFVRFEGSNNFMGYTYRTGVFYAKYVQNWGILWEIRVELGLRRVFRRR